MKAKILWVVGCLATFALGWFASDLTKGAPPLVGQPPAELHPDSSAPTASKITRHVRDDSPATTEDAAQEHIQTLLGALRDPNSMRRTRDICDTILKMVPAEFPSAVNAARKLPKKDRYELLQSLVARWAETDPRAAANFALSPDSGSIDFFGTVAGAWAQTDPRAAKDWVLSLPPCPVRSSALSSLLEATAKNDPEAALQFLLALPPASFPNVDCRKIFSAWAEKDAAAAGSRALALVPGKHRSDAFTSIVHSWAQTNPQAAIAWATQIPDPGPRRDALNDAYAI